MQILKRASGEPHAAGKPAVPPAVACAPACALYGAPAPTASGHGDAESYFVRSLGPTLTLTLTLALALALTLTTHLSP